MYKNKRIVAVVPAYNVSKLIVNVIDTIPSFVDKIVIINDFSEDETSSVVHQHPEYPGKKKFLGGQSVSSLPVFHRDYSVMLITGNHTKTNSFFINVEPGGEYIVKISLAGEGHIKLWITEYDDQNNLISKESTITRNALLLGDVILTIERPEVEFMRRFRLDPNGKKIRFGVEHMGRSKVTINKVKLERVLFD